MYDEYTNCYIKMFFCFSSLYAKLEVSEKLSPEEEMCVIESLINTFNKFPANRFHQRKELIKLCKNLFRFFPNACLKNKNTLTDPRFLAGNQDLNYEYFNIEIPKMICALLENIITGDLCTIEDVLQIMEKTVDLLFFNKLQLDIVVKIFCLLRIQIDKLLVLSKSSTVQEVNLKIIKTTKNILQSLEKFFANLEKSSGPDFHSNSYEVWRQEYNIKNIFKDRSEFEINEDEFNQRNNEKFHNAILSSDILNIRSLVDSSEKFSELVKAFHSFFKVFLELIVSRTFTFFAQNNNSSIVFSNLNPKDDIVFFQAEIQAVSINCVGKIFLLIFKIANKFCSAEFCFDKMSERSCCMVITQDILTLPIAVQVGIFRTILPDLMRIFIANKANCKDACLLNGIISNIFDGDSVKRDYLKKNSENSLRMMDCFLDFINEHMELIGYSGGEKNGFKLDVVTNSVMVEVIKLMFKPVTRLSKDDNYDKKKLFSFIIKCGIMSKNSAYFGNYLYLIRSLFKCLFALMKNNQKIDFLDQTVHYFSGILSYFIEMRKDFGILKEMLTEVILIFPIKFKYIVEYSEMVFPVLIDSLSQTPEIVSVGMEYLENWINAIYFKSEIVYDHLSKELHTITNNLITHLVKNRSLSLNALKHLSKFGGQARTYMMAKSLPDKTFPCNKSVVTLQEIFSGKEIDLSMDFILELALKILTGFTKPDPNSEILDQAFLIIKVLIMSLTSEKINKYDLERIIEAIEDDQEIEFESEYDLGDYEDILSKTKFFKLNLTLRKAETNLIEKAFLGFFIYFTFPNKIGKAINRKRKKSA